MIDFVKLRRVIKESLSPEDYHQWERAVAEYEENSHHCLVKAFFEEEAKKPAHLRKDYCHISCPCRNCSPGTL